MIYVECKPDEVLVRAVSGLPVRQIVHGLKGKYGVAAQLNKQNGARAMVDEDPGANQPAYFNRMSIAQELEPLGLRLWQHTARGNLVVVLRPRLEEWILRAAQEAQVNLASYNLPASASGLKSEITHSLDRFQRLVAHLQETPRLKSLRELLRM